MSLLFSLRLSLISPYAILQLSDEVEEDGGEAPRLLEEEFSREGKSFYEVFSLRGIRVNRVDPGFISCSFKVPLRLTVYLDSQQMKSFRMHLLLLGSWIFMALPSYWNTVY
ncbi:PREDICTED: uncharacterized protein LOC104714520 isoform X2 [Camelina sativa]|uniref:Uncharacterized protein LOC104714520 isoform X2 n=1 Tax=Camelina sativa TaxID=90675 RepID=A0ABM0TRM4_CAMSA|nr:PREDICTED: uncharacterized protein LOC104714520 isoform X2 [Camelina sativa]